MPSLKKNLFYSVLLILANYVFPFLTYPYVSRVLGVSGIGECNFVDSIINYFVLFSSLGVNALGVREIAKSKDDKAQLSRVFTNIFLVTLALTALMIIVLVVVTYTVPKLYEHKDLMLIGAVKLLFNCMLVEWLFRGLEDFRLVTIRTIAVKLLYVAAVFLFVREKDDVWIYYGLISLTIVVNALINILFARSRVRLDFSGLKLVDTFRDLLKLGVYTILTSMYTTFNVTFLGFVSGEDEVGLYTTATKIFYMVLALFTAFTNIMIPRISNVVSKGDMCQLKSFYNTALEALFGFSFPLVLWMMLMAPDIVQLIAGREFGGAVLPMVLVSPLLFVICYEQILVLQILLPLGHDNILLRNSIYGAIMGLCLNVALVPVLASTGSSIAWICSETLILVLSQSVVTKELQIKFPLGKTLVNILYYIPLALLLVVCATVRYSLFVKVLISIVLVAGYCSLYQFGIRKGQLFKELK